MQTIKTEHGTYKISDTRDAAEFMRDLKKPKRPRWKNQPALMAKSTQYPEFYPGQTSVQDYVREYWKLNGHGLTECVLFYGSLCTTPASVYDPTQPLVEVHHD